MKAVLAGKTLSCWFTLLTALLVGLSGCGETTKQSSNTAPALATSDGILTVPVPERIAMSRAIDPAGLSLSLQVNNVIVDMSSRDSSGRAVGSIAVPAGVDITVSMGWYSGLVQLASITQQLSPLTADHTETFSSGWNYDLDDDNDGFTNFAEIDAGTIATDSNSFPTELPPVIPTAESILQPVVGLWNLGVFSDEGDVVALRVNTSGSVDVLDFRGDSHDQQGDCSIISELPLAGVIGNATDGYLVDATPNSLFPFVDYSDVQLSVENSTLTLVLIDSDGDELPSVDLVQLSDTAFNTLPCPDNSLITDNSVSGVWFGATDSDGEAVLIIDGSLNVFAVLDTQDGLYQTVFGTLTSNAGASNTGTLNLFDHFDSIDATHGNSFTVAGGRPPLADQVASVDFSVANDGALTNFSSDLQFALIAATSSDVEPITLADLTGSWKAETSFCQATVGCHFDVSLTITAAGGVFGFTSFNSATPAVIPLTGTVQMTADSNQYAQIGFVWNGITYSGVIYQDRTSSKIVLNSFGAEPATTELNSFSAQLTKQ